MLSGKHEYSSVFWVKLGLQRPIRREIARKLRAMLVIDVASFYLNRAFTCAQETRVVAAWEAVTRIQSTPGLEKG